MKAEFDDAIHGIYGEHDAQDEDIAENYQALGMLAIACFVVSLFAPLTFLGWSFALIPIASLALGGIAVNKILKSPDVMTGVRFTVAGMSLSIVFWISGYSWLTYNYYTQAPEGYELVDWNLLLGNPETGALPVFAVELNERRIYIKGFMYPERYQTGIKRFSMCRTIGHCKFCEPIGNPTDVIYVKCKQGLETNFTTREIGVAGKFRLRVPTDHNLPHDTKYVLEADIIR